MIIIDYYRRIQHSIDYIEQHLTSPLLIQDIASKAFLSPFHFQRLFQAISGFSVQEYIRNRRLSEAAILIKETNKSILEIAVDYQYGSQESFTRAFSFYFGNTPAKYRKEQSSRQPLTKMDFLEYPNRLKGEIHMFKPEIVDIDTIKIIGYEYHTNLNNDTYFNEIPGFYHHFGSNEFYMRIPNKAKPAFSYGISTNFKDNGAFSFVVGEEVKTFESDLEPGFVSLEIPKGKYAEFKVNGETNLTQNAWKYIYGTWLPNSNYERREEPDFEVTDVMNSIYPTKMVMKIYIPIK